jgi:hypothetical protein
VIPKCLLLTFFHYYWYVDGLNLGLLLISVGISSGSGGIIRQSTISSQRKKSMTSWRTAEIVEGLCCQHSAIVLLECPESKVFKIITFFPVAV